MQQQGIRDLRRSLAIMPVFGIGMLLSSCDQSANATKAADANGSWQLANVEDKLTGKQSMEATAVRSLDGGGSVLLKGSCGYNGQLNINFTLKGGRHFETGSNKQVQIPYRLGAGKPDNGYSFSNDESTTATLMFGFPHMDENPNFETASLQEFRHAKEDRFELPTSGSSSEVVSINPSAEALTKLIAYCEANPQK